MGGSNSTRHGSETEDAAGEREAQQERGQPWQRTEIPGYYWPSFCPICSCFSDPTYVFMSVVGLLLTWELYRMFSSQDMLS